MSDRFYSIIRAIGGHTLGVSGRPVIIGAGRIPGSGPVILAPTHESPYDVPLLIYHSPRPLDFVSVTEVFRHRPLAWFYGNMNAFPLDRSRPDSRTVRVILSRLSAGRAVALFPEGRLRGGAASVLRSRTIRPGLGRLSELSGAPIVPCVIVNSGAYSRPGAWLPLRRTRYGIIFGEPLFPVGEAALLERRYVEEVVRLHAELRERLPAGEPRNPD